LDIISLILFFAPKLIIMNSFLHALKLLLVLSISMNAFGQTLTISSSGETGTSGNNWSITGNTLTVTGTANIRASVIQDHLLNTGPLTLEGTGTFAVTVGEAISVISGGNDLVFGTAGNTGAFTANAAISINGNVSVYGGIVTVNQNLTSTASEADILLQANNNIVLAANRTIQTDAGDITFRANAGGTPLPSEHAIRLFSGTSLLSNGGNITLGGNYDGTEGAGLYAATNRTGGRAAILLENATLTAAGGDINVYGRCVSSYDDGVLFYGNITTTGSGTIGIYGDAFGGYNGTYFGGVTVWSTTNISTDDGNVILRGVLTDRQSTSTAALNFYRSNYSSGPQSYHISILSKTGDIEISGDEGTTGAFGINHSSWGNVYVGSPGDASWIATGNVRMIYSRYAAAVATGVRVRTTGDVSYEPKGASFTSAQTIPVSANNILAQDASSLTIGKPGNTANITIAQTQTIAGDFTLYGGALALNAAITATNADINLHASGNVTQNASGVLTANNLGLHGTGNFTLTNTANNVITLAGGDNTDPLGNLSFVDASGGLEIGSVNPDGITSTGDILIETLSGDIQLNQPISTTSNTTTATGYSGAIVLNAGKSAAIGSFTGGDIKVGPNGAVSAPNGITKLYSGTDFNSTGLTTLVGGAANTRTAVDETTVNFSPVLSATGGSAYAMYRLAEGTGDLTIVASGGDALNSTWIFDHGAIRTIGSPVNVNASDVVNYLSSGDLTIEAGNITVNADIISATGNDLTLKSKGFISTLDGKTIQTDAGNIIYWADSDGDGSGYINVDGNVTLDTRTAADRTANNISNASDGGQIVLAGGSVSSSGIPTGFAAASSNTNPGIKIGHISDNWNGVTFYSGGGAITINGKSTGGAGTLSNYGGRGVFVSFMNTINAGTGTISITGEGQFMHGIEIGSSFNNPGFSAANSWNIIQAAGGTANDPAITLNGSTSNANEWGVLMGWHSGSSGNEKSLLQATGAGGISLTASNSAGTNGLRANSSAFLSATGAIDIITGTGDLYTNATGRSTGDSFFGACSTCSYSAVSSSTADVTFTFDNFSLTAGTSRVNTTGQVVVEPFGASFTAAISFPNARLVLDSGISGLRIGKAGNNANLTLSSALSVAGPISAYGNLLTVQQDIASTLQNAPITLVSHGEGTGSNNGFIILNSNVDLTTEGGNIILWSNAANRTSGTANNEIVLAGTNILTSKGGKIVLAGGLDDGANGGTAADGIPDGFAYRGGNAGEAVDIRSNITLDSDGGEIIIRGEQNGSAEGVGSDNTLTISNAGPITILGKNTTNISVRLGISNITSTVANAPVSILGTTHLRNGGLISITTQGGDVVLASNIEAADNTTNGYINLRSGLSVTTNGGDITLGGGNANGTDYAFGSSAEDYTEGVRLDLNTNLNSGGGNISIKGKSYNRGVRVGFGAAGVGFYAVANGSINSGTGTILIDGYSQTSVSQFASGILFSNTTPFTIQSANTTSDAIILNGFASGASGFAYGIEAKAGTLNVLATAAGGGITFNTGNSIANWYDAVFRGSTNILALDGPISIKGGQLGGVANGHFYTANTFNLGSKAATDITASSSDLLIEFDRLEFAGAKPQIATTGSITWQPNSASFGATQLTSDFQWNQNSQTMTALTIGKAGNTAAITHQTNPITMAGPVTIHSGALAINSALTATNNVINLFASGNVTQTAALTADDLSLNGTGNFTLQNSANDVATLAGGGAADLLGNVAYRDANALEIGTVGTQSGIFASGTVLVETENGNLTLSQNLNTTSTSDDALILNAGRATSAGTLTGGDIIINGSPTLTFGSGGRAKLFSGFEPNSTGLTDLVGAGNTRSGFDETSDLSSAGLVDDNSYAIYRVATGTGDLTIVSSGGDAEGTTWSYSNGVITTLNNTVNLLNTDLEAKLANGDVSIEAGKVTFSANVTNSTSNAFKVLSKSHILNTNATTITTQGGDVLLAANVDDATDGESAINGQIRMGSGLSITTNGGDITLGGGDNDGSGYAMGQNFNNLPEGIRVDGSIALNSAGGNIEMRGKTPAVGIAPEIGAAGIMFYNVANGSINSGTGTILMDGYSQTSGGNAIAGLLWWSLGATSFTIESANTTPNAITLNGYSTGASGQAWGIETEAPNTLNILATASGGGITINTGFQNTSEPYDIVFRGPTNILAVDGPISLKGGQFGGASNGRLFISSDLFLGSKASTAVTSSESDISIEFDWLAFNNLTPKIATTGAVSVKPANAAFGQAFSTNWFAWNQNSQTISGLTIGKPGNTSDVTHNTPITVAGPVNMYGGRVNIASNLTSSADGDIFLKAISGAAPDVQINSGVTVAKTGGTGTLTLQGHGRVNQHGTVTATAPGVLNVVLWSDFDDDDNDGGTDLAGSITTNGGHVWMGGSNSNGGSYTWNGLTVGDGPSVGDFNNNHNALDLAGSVTTNGGDFLAWAGNSHAVNGIATTTGAGNVINTGSGNITLIANQILGSGPLAIGFQTTGIFTLAPNGGAFPSGLNWNPVLGSGSFEFSGVYDYLNIRNIANVGGLVLGRYEGMLDGTDPVVIGNTADVTINTATTIPGPISVYGGDLALNAALTATDADINLHATGAVSQSAAISADGLGLHGTGTFTLTNTSNNVATIAGGDATTKLGSLSFVDAADGLTIGSVNPTGITATGPILIETLEGDITLSENVATDDTTTDAIIINAGKNANAGTAAGGDIIVSGTPTLSFGNGGMAKLFSGYASAPLTTLAGTGNSRLGVDETSSFSPALEANNTYALYRMNESNITVVASDGQSPTISNGVLRIDGTQNVNLSVITNYLQSNANLTIEATGNVTFDTALNATGTLSIVADADGNASGDISFNEDVTAAALSLRGKNTVVAAGKHVNVGGNLENHTDLTLDSRSNAFSSLKVGGAVSGTGDLTYSRYVNATPSNDLIAAPFAGMSFSNMINNSNSNTLLSGSIGGQSGFYLFGPHNEQSNSYEMYNITTNAATTLTSGKGYRAGSIDGGNLNFTVPANGYNTLSNNVTIGITHTGEGWNLVGNPYPTYLTLSQVLSENANNLYGNEFNAFYTYNGDATNPWTIYNSSNSTDIKIAPGQAFFVRAADGGATFSFTPSMQSNTGGDDFIAGRNAAETSVYRAGIELSSSVGSYTTDVYFHPNGSNGLDVGYDAASWQGSAPDYGVYSYLVSDNQGLPIAIQTLHSDALEQDSTVIPLGVEASSGYTLTLGLTDNSYLPESALVYLEDRNLGSFTNLRTGSYSVSSGNGISGTGRFFIHVGNDATLSNPGEVYSGVQVYSPMGSGVLVVTGVNEPGMRLRLYDIQGRLLLDQGLSAVSMQELPVGTLSTAAVIARLEGAQGSRSVKLIINQK
jgi:hypothetical protein